MYILKFGGRSLANQERVNAAIDIIIDSFKKRPTIVVVSALGETTQYLKDIIKIAVKGDDCVDPIQSLCTYFRQNFDHFELEIECKLLVKLIAGITLVKDAGPAVRDEILALGETISAKFITNQLKRRDLNSVFIDSRQLFITDENHLNARIESCETKENILKTFTHLENSQIPVLGGFIGSATSGKVTTFGRNGSDYTAAFLASVLGAEKLEIWKHIDGFCTVDPAILKSGQLIPQMSYRETENLLRSGSDLLHPLTIQAISNAIIPIEIRNSFKPNQNGTLISLKNGDPEYLTINQDQILISIYHLNQDELNQFYAKLITEFNEVQILDRSEFSFVINRKHNERIHELINQFRQEKNQNFSSSAEAGLISISWQIGPTRSIDQVKSILRQAGIEFEIAHSISILRRHSLIIKNRDLKKTIELVHREWFEEHHYINVALFGVGHVGSHVLKLIEANRSNGKFDIRIFASARSSELIFNGIDRKYRKPDINKLIQFAKSKHLKNLIFIDTSNSESIVTHYPQLIEAGFDIIAANKYMNAADIGDYKYIRKLAKNYNRNFLYETNVGAALPIIQTVQDLIAGGDKINRIRGVFSGSLSYLFNEYCRNGSSFSEVLQKAVNRQLTETDPRQDLSGQDVARKLLILAREIGIDLNYKDVRIDPLLPEEVTQTRSLAEFEDKFQLLDRHFLSYKRKLKKDQVWRYIAELDGRQASVKLELVDKNSNLGQLREADNLFEIYTDRYADQPLVIKGAGAGAELTASGVFSDLLKLSRLRLNKNEWSK